MSTLLKDGVLVLEGMTVYGISPWDDIEVLYVEPGLKRASTTFPSDGSGAAACWHDTADCYAHRENAEAEIMTNPQVS